MGEYALDANGHQIKLGTCQWLYYLRYEDRDKVTPCVNSLDPRETAGTRLKFRLPWPDEDHIEIGAYEHHGRLEPLYRRGNDGRVQDWTDSELSEDTGALQMKHESGLLLTLVCHHGLALPDIGAAPGISVGWNGKRAAFGLAAISPGSDDAMCAIVKCRFCGQAWRFPLADILGFVADDVLRERLVAYC